MQFLLIYFTAPPLFFGRGLFFHQGVDQNFFHKAKGGPEFFPIGKGGTRIFFTYAKEKKQNQRLPFPAIVATGPVLIAN